MNGNLPAFPIDGTVIASAAGLLMVVIATYFPGLAKWLAKKAENYKMVFLLICILIVTAAIGIVSFTGLWPIMEPTQSGVMLLLYYMVIAIVTCATGNQVLPDLPAVASIKRQREMAKMTDMLTHISPKG